MGSDVPRESEKGQEVTEVVQGWVQAVLGLPSANLGIYLLLLSSPFTITSPSENTIVDCLMISWEVAIDEFAASMTRP